MNILNFKEHTIVQLIGPSCCGKSYFAQRIKEQLGNDVVIVSSDENRRYLFGENLHKHDDRMMYMSHHAFALLHNQVDCLSSFPVNKKLIIVDSTGLSKQFRDEIKALAKKNHYAIDAVVFRYKDKADYYKYIDDNAKRFVVDKHVDRLYKKESQQIHARDYGQREIVKSIDDIPDYQFTLGSQARRKVISGKTLVVGDVHGCIDECMELCDKVTKEHICDHLVFVGDIIDKGPYSEDMVEALLFLHQSSNINHKISLIRGNHEAFVYRYNQNKFETDPNILRFFDCVNKPEKFQKELAALWDLSYDFIEHDEYIISHAPCPAKHLLKGDQSSLRNQRNFRYTHLSPAEIIQEIDGFYNHGMYTKTHIFGHVALTQPKIGRNYIGIDTGCVFGNKLTGVIIGDGKPQFYQVNAKQNYSTQEEKLLEFKLPEKKMSMDELQDRERMMVRMYIENKVNFISGSVCPADKE